MVKRAKAKAGDDGADGDERDLVGPQTMSAQPPSLGAMGTATTRAALTTSVSRDHDLEDDKLKGDVDWRWRGQIRGCRGLADGSMVCAAKAAATMAVVLAVANLFNYLGR